jgi:hypothetical protein
MKIPGLTSLLTCFLVSEAPAQAGALSAGSIRDAVVPFYVPSVAEPVAILRIANIFQDYERKGFLKIGVLPVEVMEGIDLDVVSPQEAANSLEAMRRWMKSEGDTRIELRGLKLKFATSPARVVQASQGHLGPDGCLQLLGGVTVTYGTNALHAARGSLHLTGQGAGQLILDMAVPLRLQLFEEVQKPNLQPPESKNENAPN